MNIKKSFWSLGVGLATAVLPVLGVADDAEEDRVFLYYQNMVQPQETGVYEYNDRLYIQVKVPFDSRKDRLIRKKSEVVLAAYDLLKKWAIDYSASERNKGDSAPDGVKFAKNIALAYLPEWQFREWSPKLKMREFPHKTDEGFYVLGQSVAKDDVIKNIPASFFKPFAHEDWAEALVAAVRRGVARDGREKVVAKCRAWDALVDLAKVDDAEFKAEQEAIQKYLESADLAKSMRGAQSRISGPSDDVAWSNVPGSDEVVTNVVSAAQTNELKKAVVKNAEKERPQTNWEVENLGRSCNSTVKVETETKDEEEVVETVTRTVVETRKYIRRKIVSRVRGSARFEEVFLGGGLIADKARATTKLGDGAAKTYFASSTIEVKEAKLVDALRENPADAKLWNLYGKCLATKEDYVGAAICFKVSLRLDRDYEFALVNLAEAYQAIGIRNLAVGLATYARAVAKDKWCVTHAEALLAK